MSDNVRKRSRKSKLVPRHVAEYVAVEDDSVLQEPAKKKLLLDKIKKEPDDFVPPDSASHEFSVKVEVEDVEASVPEEDSSSYMQYLFSLSKEDQDTEPASSFEFADNNLLLENKLALEEENNCYVDVRKVQSMLASLHKKHPSEREAVLHTRNQWGKVFNERYECNFHKTPLDNKLQDVLEQWRKWTITSRTRDSPFSYKCYICLNAWWSFTEFKSHLTIHENVNCKLHIEIREQECSIIAYEGNIPGFQEIFTHGKCLKCAKTYAHHLTNRTDAEAFYSCNYCKDKFFLCSALAKHEGKCSKNPIRVLSLTQHGKEFKFSDFSCQICHTVFLSNTDLTEHLVICHKVRSDEPVIAKLKDCKFCSRSYCTFQYHICLKKNMVHECKYCNAKFQNKQMMETHLDMWNTVVRCRICDKFLLRGCMAGQHYALHSENFVLVHRCLICRKKMKIFTDEESMRQHNSKYHSRIIGKRPQSDMIIMAKLMLQQCLIDPNAKKTIPKILREPQKAQVAPASVTSDPTVTPTVIPATPVSSTTPVSPATLVPPTDPPPAGSKMTRGQPMQKVRVFDKKEKKNKKSNNDRQMKETTICHDNEISKVSDEVPLVKEITIKEEKIDDKTKENDQIDYNKEPENELSEISNTAIKVEPVEVHEVIDIVKSEQDKVEERNDVEIEEQVPNVIISEEDNIDIETQVQYNQSEQVTNILNEEQEQNSRIKIESEGSKDLPKLMEELNEFLDIKPDIIRVKEEKLSDNESQANSHTFKVDIIAESDLSRVFQSSSTFAEEVTENSEHSNVFHVSRSILEETIVKQEIKEEPDDDLIIVECDIKKERTGDKELSLLNLEPEVILKAGYRKRKIYKCARCDFSAYHREYREHINNHCMEPKKTKQKKEADLVFKCTKCGSKFANIKRYVLHFEKHGYRYMTCPQCNIVFDSVTKLIPHFNHHIKSQFIRMLVISDSEDKDSKVFQCKTCKGVENARGSFEHWERHLELMKEASDEVEEVPVSTSVKVSYQQSLTQEATQRIIELLTNSERTGRNKTCCVCDRIFERRNDIKRHYIEHLLEDAFANITDRAKLKCQICGELFRKPDAYKKHMRDHASLPIYQCSLCNKTFSDSSNFTKHKKIHNLKAYVCDICGKKFQAKVSLEKHIMMHMRMEPIRCERCGKVFQDRSFYKRHCRQFHDKKHKHKCLLCKEKFNFLKDKWDHMWETHKIRKDPADCPVCHKSYRKLADVKKHAAQEHGVSITLSGGGGGDRLCGDGARPVVREEADSSDDCLIIEEERETLVVYD